MFPESQIRDTFPKIMPLGVSLQIISSIDLIYILNWQKYMTSYYKNNI